MTDKSEAEKLADELAFAKSLIEFAEFETAKWFYDPDNAYSPDGKPENHPAYKAGVMLRAIFDPENQPSQYGTSLTPSGLTSDEAESLRFAAGFLAEHGLSVDAKNVLDLRDRLTSSQAQEPSDDKAALTDAEIMSVVRYSTVGSKAVPDSEWCAFARALIARLSAQGARTTVHEGFKVVPVEIEPDSDLAQFIEVNMVALTPEEFWAECLRLSASPSPVTEGWRDIATAPPDRSRVLVGDWNGKEWSYVREAEYKHGCYFDRSDAYRLFPTHWRPLPAPPAPQASNKEGE